VAKNLVQSARQALAEGRARDCERMAKKNLQPGADQLAWLQLLIDALRVQRKHDDLIKVLLQIESVNDASFVLHKELLELLVQTGQAKRALAIANRWLATMPAEPAAYRLASLAHRLTGAPQTALELAQQTAQLAWRFSGDAIAALNDLCAASHRAGRQEEALAHGAAFIGWLQKLRFPDGTAAFEVFDYQALAAHGERQFVLGWCWLPAIFATCGETEWHAVALRVLQRSREGGPQSRSPDWLEPDEWDRLGALANRGALPISFRTAMLRACGMSTAGPVEWNRRMFERCLLPAFARTWETREWALALSLNQWYAFTYAKQPQTEAHAVACYGRFADSTPESFPEVSDLRKTWPEGCSQVAFVTDYGVNASSPIHLLYALLRSGEWRSAGIMPTLISLVTENPTIAEFDLIGVPWVVVTKTVHDVLAPFPHGFAKLAGCLDERKIDTLVLFNSSEALRLVLGRARLAPAQVDFSTGFHYPLAGEIDGGISMAGARYETGRKINGDAWRMLPAIGVKMDFPGGKASAAQIRRRWPAGKVLLGTLATPAKINNDAFLDTVANILAACPNAIYLWCGSEQLGPVQDGLQARGIAGRCAFMGYVDQTMFASLLDLHLDSHPFPTGVAARTMASAGTAQVLWCGSGAAGSLGDEILPVLEGKMGAGAQAELEAIFGSPGDGDALPFTRDPAQYAALAIRLVQDAAARQRAGTAMKRYAEQYIENVDAVVRQMIGHLRSIGDERGLQQNPTQDTFYENR
jgi:tetratricopeptide (TPR) repeat protein